MRNRKQDKSKSLYMRATAVVLNPQQEVLLVKHNRESMWALPGGRMRAGEDLGQRAMLEVAEETGLIVKQPKYVGRYAGSVASHEIYLAQSIGEPRPNHKELQDAVWWDGVRPLQTQQHVSAILAIVGNSMATVDDNATDESATKHNPREGLDLLPGGNTER